MADPQQFRFSEVRNQLGEVALRPLLPLTIFYESRSIEAVGLVDSGSDLNILPHRFGLSLGLNWQEYEILPPLSGALGQFETRAVVLLVEVRPFADVSLAFGWSASDDPPLILGQVNFFAQYNICFFRGQNMFEVQPK